MQEALDLMIFVLFCFVFLRGRKQNLDMTLTNETSDYISQNPNTTILLMCLLKLSKPQFSHYKMMRKVPLLEVTVKIKCYLLHETAGGRAKPSYFHQKPKEIVITLFSIFLKIVCVKVIFKIGFGFWVLETEHRKSCTMST